MAKTPLKSKTPVQKKKETLKVQKEVNVSAKDEVKEKKKSKGIETVEPTTSAKKTVEVDDKTDISIERKLVALYQLQLIDTEINKIRIVRGELPLEVQDLEDEIEGLETRVTNYNKEIENLEISIKEKRVSIKEFQALIKKYETQQQNVRNNREYDSITKEIEYQQLEIQLCDKRIKEFALALDSKKELIAKTKQVLKERNEDLKNKKQELEEIVSETEKEENKLTKKLADSQKIIEERLLTAYQKIKKNARNGLAVVVVERDACGGCFNKIPPQRQLDIKMNKKIIVCEYCGRILVDSSIEVMAAK